MIGRFLTSALQRINIQLCEGKTMNAPMHRFVADRSIGRPDIVSCQAMRRCIALSCKGTVQNIRINHDTRNPVMSLSVSPASVGR